jgi:hypothetical protein
MSGDMSRSIFEYRLDVLLKEWEFAQAQIGQFDTIAMSIRGWAVSLFSAMLAASITLKNPDLLCWAPVPIILFWLLDALFKSFQERVIERSHKIEAYLRSQRFAEDAKSQAALGFETPFISSVFKVGLPERARGVLRAAAFLNVMLLHGSLLVTCIIAHALLPGLISQGSG